MASSRLSAPPVPVFFLYGEPRRTVSPRFLHLERLEERSRPTDWRIRPHAHTELHHLFLIAAGAGRMDSDGRVTEFAAPCVLAMPAGCVHGFAWEPETRGHVLTLAASYFDDVLVRAPEFSAVFAQPGCLAGLDEGAMDRLLASLARELAWSAPGHAAAVDAHLLMILVEVLRLRQRTEGAAPRSPGPAVQLVARFRELVERRFRSGCTVAQYASHLGVTPPMLRRACAQVARASPIGIVHERVFLEAQRVLLYTNMSIGEAAAHLGFEDSAYFSRFFSRHARQSPRRFREAGSQI